MAADHAAGLLVSHSSRVFAYELTRGFARRILLLSRRCRTTPLRFALRCMRTAFSVGAPRARPDALPPNMLSGVRRMRPTSD